MFSDDEIAQHIAAGRSAYPDVVLSREAYAEHVAKVATQHAVPAADLYLAAACTLGDPAALAAFRAQLMPAVRRALDRIGMSPALADEAEQRVWIMLFVGESPQIAQYRGRGRLASWVRSIAVRTGRRMLGAQGTDDGRALSDLPAAVRDPELEVMREAYAPQVRDALARALTALEPRQRNVLRQYYIDELTIDDLATLYRINRATAARWVAGARLRLVTLTRDLLIDELGVDASEVDSIIRLVRSELEISVRQLV